jgi:hypothetical protein
MSAWRGHKEDCVQWIENTIHLPLGLSAEPAQIKLPIYLPEIAAATASACAPGHNSMRRSR